MTLSSLGRVGTTDTNCTSNSNPRLSPSRSPSPSYDTLSGRTELFPGIQSHALLSPDVRLTPAAQQDLSDQTSVNSSAMNTPNPSRSTSPLPRFYSSTQSSSSDTDSDGPVSPLLLDTYASPYSRTGPPRWWQRQRPRRGPRRSAGWGRPIVRVLRRVFRHPFFPKHPSTIVRPPFSRPFVCPRVRLKALSPAPFSSVFLPISTIHNFPPDPPVEP